MALKKVRDTARKKSKGAQSLDLPFLFTQYEGKKNINHSNCHGFQCGWMDHNKNEMDGYFSKKKKITTLN
jgi:hypothetical protein